MVVVVPLLLGLVLPELAVLVFLVLLLAVPIMAIMDLMRRFRCQGCGAVYRASRRQEMIDQARMAAAPPPPTDRGGPDDGAARVRQ